MSRRRTPGVAAAAIVVALGLASCGERPRPAPEAAMADRARSRIALIDYVVKDDARRERVVRIHLALEELTLAFAAKHQALTAELLGARRGDRSPEAFEERLAALYAVEQRDTRAFMARYAALQLALRENLTPDEFARLDAIR